MAPGLLALLALAACGAKEPVTSPSSSASTAPSSPLASAATFNPCDGLDIAPVEKALGARLRVEKGTSAAPRCALLPEESGGTAYELNYLPFKGTLAEAWETMDVESGEVEEPGIEGAADARLVTQEGSSSYAITGFVQNGNLIQSFNSVDLDPYDAAAMDRAALALLEQLSANASD